MMNDQTRLTKEILPGVSIRPKVIDTALGRVEYDLTEGDGPVVLASHGGIGGVDQARLMLNWLDAGLDRPVSRDRPASRYRLLSVSRPGYLGTPLSSGQSINAQADLFAALLDALGIDQAAVVTLSAGGPMGYAFAMRHPRRVWALVAISSVSGYYAAPQSEGSFFQAIFMSPWGQRVVNWLMQNKPALLLGEMIGGTGSYTKAQLGEHVDFALHSPPALAFARGLMRAMQPYPSRQPGTENDMALFRQLTHLPLEGVRCPALIIHGTQDADVKFYDGVYAYEHVPGAQRLWLEGGSHLSFWLTHHAEAAQGKAREFLECYRV